LSKLVGSGKIYTVEIDKTLARKAKGALKDYTNVQVLCKDGSKGLPDKAPFDRIIVTAGAPEEPLYLLDQLTDPGIMLVPVGVGIQRLNKYIKDKTVVVEDLGAFAFVPLKKT
jgi:protein-L-isoaspartate(D-aspartate) O-methyltransferase